MTHVDEQASAIATRHALYAACVGLIPMPLLAWAAMAAIHATMLAAIGALYGVPFKATPWIVMASAVAGSLVAVWVGDGIAGSLAKTVPIAGPALGLVWAPVVAYLVTLGMGRAFVSWRTRGRPPA